MSTIAELASMQANGSDPIAGAEQLAALLDLGSVGLEVRGARVVGRGSTASADLFLSDGSTITFETLRDVATPKSLALEIAACTGATPNVKAAQAIKAVALIRQIAEHHATRTVDHHSVDLGLGYLQSAVTRPVDMNDQHARWEAFCALERSDPLTDTRHREVTVAQASIVLVDGEGTRYVRAGWFQAHARREDPAASPKDIGDRMTRVGWQRRGSTGRIKATRPGNPGQLVWPFFLIAKGWEDQC